MTSHKSMLTKEPYLFNSRVLSHTLFWISYYVVFSLIWAKEGNYYASFGLELVLMPIRILVAYVTLYYLMPRFLLKDRIVKFLLTLLAALIIAGAFQRLLIYFFYELFFNDGPSNLWTLASVIRAIVLINSTVLFLGALKMYKYWKAERDSNARSNQKLVEIKSEKRIFRINPSDILYIEGLGNYVTYYVVGRKPLISYSSLKDVERGLPPSFVRIHKSFVANKDWVESYTADNIEIQGRILPLGKSVELTF